jgi:hypothetical protein
MGNYLNQFYAKTWIFVVYAGFFGMIGSVLTIIGLTMLCGFVMAADGRSTNGLAISILILGVVMIAFSALAILNIHVRRNPVLQVNSDGLELEVIGRSSLKEIPRIQSLWRASRQQRLWAPLASVRAVEITGHSMERTLTIRADFFDSSSSWREQQPPLTGEIAFSDGELDGSLEEIAETIKSFARPSY